MSEKLKDLIEQGGSFAGFKWPDNICDFQIRIGRDGTWYYQDSPIGRLKLCQLFATVLQLDDIGNYWLVTPGEKGQIEVEDAPFTAIELKVTETDTNQSLSFRTNLDHWVTADQGHPIRIEINDVTGEPSPYIMVRDGLEARLNRAVFYQLVDLATVAVSGNTEQLFVQSNGCEFLLGEV